MEVTVPQKGGSGKGDPTDKSLKSYLRVTQKLYLFGISLFGFPLWGDGEEGLKGWGPSMVFSRR